MPIPSSSIKSATNTTFFCRRCRRCQNLSSSLSSYFLHPLSLPRELIDPQPPCLSPPPTTLIPRPNTFHLRIILQTLLRPSTQVECSSRAVLDKWGKKTGLEPGISLHQISDLDLSKDDIDDEWVARDGEGRILGQKIRVLRWRPTVLKVANLAAYLMDIRGGGQRGREVWRWQQRMSVVLVAGVGRRGERR
ncbi:hypothetical protein Ancab_000601 [Ancistrocladus abbreviatus]